MASGLGHLKVVKELLQHKHLNVNAQRFGDDMAALLAASGSGHVEVVLELLKRNDTDVNVLLHDGSSALHGACQHRHMEVVRALLQHNNMDVNVKKTMVQRHSLWRVLMAM